MIKEIKTGSNPKGICEYFTDNESDMIVYPGEKEGTIECYDLIFKEVKFKI